ncbi:MAG: hypothetical protein V3V40_06360 [Nitrosomonadaceae bacterium]
MEHRLKLSQKHSFIGVVIILLGFQLWDYKDIPKEPMQTLYAFNATMDYAMLMAVLILYQFAAKSKNTRYILYILAIQVICLILHGLGLINQIAYDKYDIELLAVLNDAYTPTLKAWFWVKMFVLARGGYGVIRRSRKKYTGSTTNPGLIIIRNTPHSKSSLREEVRY